MALPQYITTEAGERLVTEVNQDFIVGERTYAPYEGFNIFDVRANWQGNPQEQIRRNMTILQNTTGRPTTRSHTATPITRYTMQVAIEGREEIKAFRSWLRTLRGRQVQVWVPTWVRDLEATVDLSGSSITVESVGYTGWLYPHAARKHLAIIQNDGTINPVGVTSASDNGTTETLGISPSLTGTLIKEHTMISFLLLCRLGEDEIRVDWFGNDYGEAEMAFVELPREAPTP